ncbi:MAG: hypothetical protein QXV85_09465 [Candidatus Bathyarchaeia archaeon]
MRYRESGKSAYAQRQPKIFVPKGLKGEARKFYKTVAIRPAGEWSRDLLKKTEGGKVLAVQHFDYVVKTLEKEKPKTKAEAEKVIKKAMMSPQQRFVILYEKSLREPLSATEFREYLDLFKECFPVIYKGLYGNRQPAQIVVEAFKPSRVGRK